MTLTPTRTILDDAHAAGRGVGAFNVIHLETAEALTGAAEAAGLPVILQLSENCIRYHGAFEPIALATLAVAAASSAPVAVHLDHAEDPELALLAIDRGFGSVMYDGAKLDFADNVATTRRIVERANAAGVLVEAELGEIGGKDGAHAPGVRTDPDRGRAVRRGDGRRCARRRRGLLARDDRTRRGDRHRPRRTTGPRRVGSAGAARVFGGARRVDRQRHPRGPDEDQRVNTPERPVHGRDPGVPGEKSGGSGFAHGTSRPAARPSCTRRRASSPSSQGGSWMTLVTQQP